MKSAGLNNSSPVAIPTGNMQDQQRKNSTVLRDDTWPKLLASANQAPRPATHPTVVNYANAGQQVRVPNPRFPSTKKKFMNTRMGGKLSYNPPTSPDTYKMKVDSGYSMFETWGYALLGQYVGKMPSDFLINEMKKQWNVRAKFRVEEGWIIFTFESESDQEMVLQEGPYFIQGRPLLVKRVPDKFSFHRRDVALIPLWVRLHGLGKRYWHPDILSDIGSFIGKPLYMDTVTDERKRSSYARVLFEINLAAPIKKKITLGYDDGDSFDCELFVENQPKFFKSCCSLGHNELECSAAFRRASVQTAPPPRHVSFVAAVKAPPVAATSAENRSENALIPVDDRNYVAATSVDLHSLSAATGAVNTMCPSAGVDMLTNAAVSGSVSAAHKTANSGHMSTEVSSPRNKNGPRDENSTELNVKQQSNVINSDEHVEVEDNTRKILQTKENSGMGDQKNSEIKSSTGQLMSCSENAMIQSSRKDHGPSEKHTTTETVPPSASLVHLPHDEGLHTRNMKMDVGGENENMGTVHEQEISDDGDSWTEASAETEDIIEKEKSKAAKMQLLVANDPILALLHARAHNRDYGKKGHNNNKKKKSKAKR